jgi:signal recognition particle subunit SRP54
MAGRILGMGDIVSLVDEVRQSVNVEEAQKLAAKLKKGDSFDLEDFKAQLGQMKNIGSFSSLMEKMPAQLAQAAGQIDDAKAKKQLARTEGIINSMTPHERRKPEIIKASRKKRIAAGAGVTVQEVNQLLRQFEQSREVMKMMKKGGMAKMMRAFKGLSGRFPGMGGF